MSNKKYYEPKFKEVAAFEEQFSSLKIKEQIPLKLKDLRYSRWTMEQLLKDIQKYCLDKQRVKKILRDLQETIGKQGINIALYDLIEEKKKELGLEGDETRWQPDVLNWNIHTMIEEVLQ